MRPPNRALAALTVSGDEGGVGHPQRCGVSEPVSAAGSETAGLVKHRVGR